MKYQVYLALTLGLVAPMVLAVDEDVLEHLDVFSNEIIDPKMTLGKLQAAAENLPDGSSSKEKIQKLIALSEIKDEKCDMIPFYSYSIATLEYRKFINVIAYTEYYKEEQFGRCRSILVTQVEQINQDQREAIQELKNSLVGAIESRSRSDRTIAIHSLFDVPKPARAEILYKFFKKRSGKELGTDFTVFKERFNTVIKDVCSLTEPMKPIVDAYKVELYENRAKELVDDFVKDWITNVNVCSGLLDIDLSHEAFASYHKAV